MTKPEPENFFAFLTEASTDENLDKIRQDSEHKKNDDIENEVEPEDESDLEEERKGKRKPKKTPIKSETLEHLIEKHSPRYKCTQATTSCLLKYVTVHIPYFGDRYRDLKLFETQLEQLEKIIHHLIRTGYIRNYFVFFTNAFRDFLIPRGETWYKKWYDLVQKHLHTDKARVLVYLKNADDSRTAKLQDGYTEIWDNVEHSARALFRRGEEGNAKTFGASTLLALELCTGARKAAFLDPNVKFYTWEDWKNHRHDNRNEMGINDIGSDTFSLTLQDLSNDKFTSSLIVQVGILKDAKNKLQKHLPEEDRDDPRFLIKPCLVYTADFLVEKIKSFRGKYEITKENFIDRRSAGAQWDTRLFHKLLDDYFHNSFEHAKRKGWTIGSHHMRRIYVMATLHFFKDSAEVAAGGKVLAQSVWMALVLGHMGSVNTTITYSNLKLVVNPPPKAMQLPPTELILQFAKQVADLQGQVDKIQRSQSSLEAAIAVMNASSDTTAAFVKPDGTAITLQKHTKRKYADEADKQNTVKRIARTLKENGLEVNAANIGKMGIGGKLRTQLLKILKNNGERDGGESPAHVEEQEQKQTHVEPAVAPPPAEDNSELDHKHNEERPQRAPKRAQTQHEAAYGKNKQYAKLGAKQKVISHSSEASEGANIERHRRDLKNTKLTGKVIEKPEDCNGRIIPSVQLGPKLVRDVCAEK